MHEGQTMEIITLDALDGSGPLPVAGAAEMTAGAVGCPTPPRRSPMCPSARHTRPPFPFAFAFPGQLSYTLLDMSRHRPHVFC
jgi:hypothetical protein